LIALGRYRVKAAFATADIAKMLLDENYYVRCMAADALGAIGEGSAEAVPDLIKALDVDDYIDGDRYVESLSRHAAAGLGQMGDAAEPAVPHLLRILRKGNINGLDAGTALARIGRRARSAIPDLIELLKYDDVNIRAAAARALGAIGDVKTVGGALQRAIDQEQSPSIKAEMVGILEKLKTE
jgi:HEAT repeat protein